MTGVSIAHIQSHSKRNEYENSRRIIAKAASELGYNRYLVVIGMEKTQYRMLQLLEDAELHYRTYEDFKEQTDKIIQHFKTMKKDENQKDEK